MELLYMAFYRNNSLYLSETSIGLKSIERGSVETENVTGIDYIFGETSIDNEKYKKYLNEGYSETEAIALSSQVDKFFHQVYFVGEKLPFEQVKDYGVKPTEKMINSSFVVVRNEKNEIVEIRPIDDNTFVVGNVDELYTIYQQITGYEFPKKKNK